LKFGVLSEFTSFIAIERREVGGGFPEEAGAVVQNDADTAEHKAHKRYMAEVFSSLFEGVNLGYVDKELLDVWSSNDRKCLLDEVSDDFEVVNLNHPRREYQLPPVSSAIKNLNEHEERKKDDQISALLNASASLSRDEHLILLYGDPRKFLSR